MSEEKESIVAKCPKCGSDSFLEPALSKREQVWHCSDQDNCDVLWFTATDRLTTKSYPFWESAKNL